MFTFITWVLFGRYVCANIYVSLSAKISAGRIYLYRYWPDTYRSNPTTNTQSVVQNWFEREIQTTENNATLRSDQIYRSVSLENNKRIVKESFRNNRKGNIISQQNFLCLYLIHSECKSIPIAQGCCCVGLSSFFKPQFLLSFFLHSEQN